MVRLCGLAQLGGLLVHWKKHCKWLKKRLPFPITIRKGSKGLKLWLLPSIARTGKSKQAIREYIETTFLYDLNFSCDEIRPDYCFNPSCQGTVPEAIVAFLESTDFETAIRLVIYLGGDSDTLACITGGIAEAFYGMSEDWEIEVLRRLPRLCRSC